MPLKTMRNTLYFGDTLNVMREMPTHSYHLCYFDPPFNSGRNYNIFLAGFLLFARRSMWRYRDKDVPPTWSRKRRCRFLHLTFLRVLRVFLEGDAHFCN